MHEWIILYLHKRWNKEIFLISGNYSAKLGYWAARNLSCPTCNPPVQGSSVTTLLAQVWTFKSSRKIKHFILKTLSGCLAIYQRLAFRHLETKKGFSRYDVDQDFINNILFERLSNLHIWALSPTPSTLSSFSSLFMFSNMDCFFGAQRRHGLGLRLGIYSLHFMVYMNSAKSKFFITCVNLHQIYYVMLCTKQKCGG